MIGQPGPPWATGFAKYWIDRTAGQHALPVAVLCRIGRIEAEDYALLDTGAAWSVIGGDLVELISHQLTEPGAAVTMSTRLGPIHGELHRLPITLIASEGDDLEVDATVVVSSEWTGPVVLGYRGFLERLRLGLDPGIQGDDQWLSFGAGGSGVEA